MQQHGWTGEAGHCSYVMPLCMRWVVVLHIWSVLNPMELDHENPNSNRAKYIITLH